MSIVFEQAAQASLARLRGRVAGEGDPQVASDISRVALMGGVGSSSTGMAGAGGGLEVRSKAEPPVLLVLMTLRALLRTCLVVGRDISLRIQAQAPLLVLCRRYLLPLSPIRCLTSAYFEARFPRFSSVAPEANEQHQS